MRSEPVAFGLAQGHLPALGARDSQHPLLDRRRINTRWLLATVLMAASSAALLLAALSVVSGERRLAARRDEASVRPVLWSGEAVLRLADRLAPGSEPEKPEVNAVKVEQVGPSGTTLRPYRYIVAKLALLGTDRAETPSPPAPPRSLPRLFLSGGQGPLAAGPLSRLTAYAPADPVHDPRQIGKPLNVTEIEKTPSPPGPQDRVIVAKQGDSLQLILRALGLNDRDTADILSGFGDLPGRGMAAFAGGERLVLTETGPQQRPLKIRLDWAGAPAGAVTQLDNGHYVRVKLADELSDSIVRKAMAALSRLAEPDRLRRDEAPAVNTTSIRDSLYALADTNGLSRDAIDEIIRIAQNSVDLGAPIAEDDTVALLAGSADEPAKAGAGLRLVALNIRNRQHRFYRFTAPDDNSVDYYDDAGRSVSKFLLRKPVANGRLGDGFGWRIHPVLGDRRFHEGVDYAAPFGSPIVAAASGVVEKIAWQRGYGKYIRLRHDDGYETTYAHDSGFPPWIKVGSRVQQGETIAYIGSTGLSTGPHLYYEVRVNGHNADPLRIKLAGGRILQGEVLVDFQKVRQRDDTLAAAASAPPS